ncbi:MAG TPA: transporter substrate-binding domain-containing protein, partial [bacterium]|nr:transporter substrate-binding domain-containing protein [bacterium]
MRPVITFSVCAALAVFAAAFAPSRVFAEKIVRVGIYENKPKVFTGEDGKPAGFFVELVEEIAKREGWTIRFERCEWADCLKRLEDGSIDLMPDVAYSIERDERFDFHKKPVAESWSRVYTNSSKSIAMMSDLNGRKVALLEGSIQQ